MPPLLRDAAPDEEGRQPIKTSIQKVRRVIRFLAGRDFFPTLDCRCRKERFGSPYGGWDVAVEGIDEGWVVYSAGVGEDVSFDVALIERFGVAVHAFDPTPTSIAWAKAQGLPPRFILHEYGLAAVDGTATFYPPKNPEDVSHTLLAAGEGGRTPIFVPVKRLSSIMGELGHDRVDLLKMDIEAAEYGVIDDVLRTRCRPRQVLVEFHHRFPAVGIERTKESLRKLREAGYGLFSVSASGEELCFIFSRESACGA